MSVFRRRFWIALSLANLCFIGVWAQILALDSPRSFYFDAGRGDFFAAALSLLLLALLLSPLVIWAAADGPGPAAKLGRLVLLLVPLVPLGIVRRQLGLTLGDLRSLAGTAGKLEWALAAVLLVVVVSVVLRWERAMTRAVLAALRYLLAFLVLMCGRGLWVLAATHGGSAFASTALVSPPLAGAPAAGRLPRPRVVVVVLDELDYRLSAPERTTGVALPELERLRSHGLDATHAFPPGQNTLISLPALLTGLPVREAIPDGPRELILHVGPSLTAMRWGAVPNLFARARAVGVTSALAGWHLPYCRVVGSAVERCYWEPGFDISLRGQRQSFFASMRDELLSVTPWDQHLQHLRSYERMLDSARAMLADRSTGLVFLHLPVPHLPAIYDRRSGRFTINNTRPTGYLDNLVLADRTLGALRAALEAQGTWDGTTILVTGDHWYRNSTQLDGRADLRVPFILKIANDTEAVRYSRPFRTVVTSDLVLSLLDGEVRSTAQAAQWLDRQPFTR